MQTTSNSTIQILALGQDKLFARQLAKNLKELGYSNLTISTNSAEFSQYFLHEYQVAIFDITHQNKHIAFSLIKNLKAQRNIPVIIISELDKEQYIDEATKLKVSAYLAKFPTSSQLKISIRRALSKQAFNWIGSGKRNFRFQKENIYCIVADGHFSNIYLENGRKIIINSGITQLIQAINYPELTRVHRSYYVNLNLVESYSRTEIFLPFEIHRQQKKVKSIPVSKSMSSKIVLALKSRQL